MQDVVKQVVGTLVKTKVLVSIFVAYIVIVYSDIVYIGQ